MKNTLFVLAAAAGSASAASPAYGQCGGQGWSGDTTCVSGYTCTKSNDYYSQCLPGGNGGSSPTTTKAPTSSVRATTSVTTANSAATGLVQYAGVNIAGLDFGCTIDGTCKTTSVVVRPF